MSAPYYMQFTFIIQTNSNDVDYETTNARFWVKRVLGDPYLFECDQLLPEEWTPGDPIPDPNAPEEDPEEGDSEG